MRVIESTILGGGYSVQHYCIHYVQVCTRRHTKKYMWQPLLLVQTGLYKQCIFRGHFFMSAPTVRERCWSCGAEIASLFNIQVVLGF